MGRKRGRKNKNRTPKKTFPEKVNESIVLISPRRNSQKRFFLYCACSYHRGLLNEEIMEEKDCYSKNCNSKRVYLEQPKGLRIIPPRLNGNLNKTLKTLIPAPKKGDPIRVDLINENNSIPFCEVFQGGIGKLLMKDGICNGEKCLFYTNFTKPYALEKKPPKNKSQYSKISTRPINPSGKERRSYSSKKIEQIIEHPRLIGVDQENLERNLIRKNIAIVDSYKTLGKIDLLFRDSLGTDHIVKIISNKKPRLMRKAIKTISLMERLLKSEGSENQKAHLIEKGFRRIKY